MLRVFATRRICFKITPRRLTQVILSMACVTNLLIVGFVFVDETSTPGFVPNTGSTSQTPMQAGAATLTLSATQTDTPSSSPTWTSTTTQTPSLTPTQTVTASITSTFTPSVTPCALWSFLPVYRVQAGDTLYHLASLTDSTVNQIKEANCLSSDVIYLNQVLFLPRLPPVTNTPVTPYLPVTTYKQCFDFENQKSGSVFYPGDVLPGYDQSLTISVGDFYWSNGNPAAKGGYASIAYQGAAGGYGAELAVNNVNINFYLNEFVDTVSLHFGEYGGNLNLNVNGDFYNIDNFNELDGRQIGGVKVTVFNGNGNDTGGLELYGPIKYLAIGGRELWIDDVCYGAAGG